MEAQELVGTVPLLRPDQVEEMEGEKDAMQRKLANPAIQDKAIARDQLRRLTAQLETQAPRPYTPEEIDSAVKLEAELRGKWSQGMLSHEEMRKSPPGAVDRHRTWEKKNKRIITAWQNVQRRLSAGSGDTEAASIERFRPTASAMNMDGALIPGKQFFLPPAGAGLPVTFSEEQLQILRTLNPQVAEILGTLSNVQRAEVKKGIDLEARAEGLVGAENAKKNKGGRPKKVTQ